MHQGRMEEEWGMVGAFTLAGNRPWSSFAQQEGVCEWDGRRSPASRDPDAAGPCSMAGNIANLPEKKT